MLFSKHPDPRPSMRLFRPRPWMLSRGRLLLAMTALTALLNGCAGKPELPPAPGVSITTGDIFAEPDFPRLIRSVEHTHGPVAGARIRHWAMLVERGKTLDTHEQLLETNRFFNGARFSTDREIWQVDDYWATPAEFLIKDAGDCEEFAIAKYFTLRFMGLEDEKMRLTYVKALTLDQPHMVLSYYPAPDEVPLVLDNLNPRLLPADARNDLVPVYSFNSTKLWLAKTGKDQTITANTEAIKNLRPWQSLLQRFKEGF